MNPTATLHRAGQSLWLDNITRDLLDSGTLERYIVELSITGLTSNPTIYEKAIGGSDAYDEPMRVGLEAGLEGEAAAGVDVDAVGQQLQDDGADSFVESWRGLMKLLQARSRELEATQ